MIQKCLIRREMAKKNWRQMAFFGVSGGTVAVFFKVSKHLCQVKTFFYSYLHSEIKTKPKNHGLRESGNPPYLSYSLRLISIIIIRVAEIPERQQNAFAAMAGSGPAYIYQVN